MKRVALVILLVVAASCAYAQDETPIKTKAAGYALRAIDGQIAQVRGEINRLKAIEQQLMSAREEIVAENKELEIVKPAE